MVKCLTGAKFTMKATILHQDPDVQDTTIIDPEDPNYGSWVDSQDPLTGEIIRVWEPTPLPDNPDTEFDESTQFEVVNCLARGVNYKSGRDEKFGEEYRALDSVNLWVPSGVSINRRDRVTNISTRTGTLLWVSETKATTPQAMVFNVVGVTPIIDPFGRHTETYAVLERSEV